MNFVFDQCAEIIGLLHSQMQAKIKTSLSIFTYTVKVCEFSYDFPGTSICTPPIPTYCTQKICIASNKAPRSKWE